MYIQKRIPIHEGATTVARTTRPLTNTEVLRSKALEKDLTLHDSNGFFLIVKTSEKKFWRFRYQSPLTKQLTMMGLGAFPALSLANARGLRADYLALLANGIAPQIQAEAADEEQQIALDSIFSKVAANCFQLKSQSVTPDYAKDIWRYGSRLVAHGLHSIASTAMNEEGFNPDTVDAALTHSDKNEVR